LHCPSIDTIVNIQGLLLISKHSIKSKNSVSCVYFLRTYTEEDLGFNTDKKENKSFLINREIYMGSGAKSYMRKGFLIYEEMHKYFHHI
jgi:hypothetical protein